MSQNLLDYRPFVNEAYVLHLTGALGTSTRIYLPYLFYALAPHQLRYSLWLIAPYIDDFAVLKDLAFFLPVSPRILLLIKASSIKPSFFNIFSNWPRNNSLKGLKSTFGITKK
jgi:hypothetical protein